MRTGDEQTQPAGDNHRVHPLHRAVPAVLHGNLALAVRPQPVQPVQPAQPGTSQPTRPARAVYFMPVIAMPSTKRFCTKKNTMSNGRAEISAPAITTPYGVTDEP